MGTPTNADAIVVQGKYGKAIVDQDKITIVNETQGLLEHPIYKVEVKRYKNAFETHTKFDQEVAVCEGIRTELFPGDQVDFGYTYEEYLGNSADIRNGLETHIVVHPYDAPPERFVVGYTDDDECTYRIRYDDPERAETLCHSPKTLLPKVFGLSKSEVRQMQKEKQLVRQQAQQEAEESWQELPGGVKGHK